MWGNILIIGILMFVSCLIMTKLLNLREKKFQKNIDNGNVSLLSYMENTDRNSPKENIEKIKTRIKYIENYEGLQDYSVEIAEYENYVKVLINGKYESNQARYLKELIKILKERTGQYVAYNELNKNKNNIRYDLNINDNITNLNKIYKSYELRVRQLVNRKFDVNSLTNKKIISNIDNWTEIFNENSESLSNLLSLDKKHTMKYQNEITTKLSLLKQIIDKMGKLEVSIVLNLDKNKIGDNEIKEVVEDMEKIINTIPKYK